MIQLRVFGHCHIQKVHTIDFDASSIKISSEIGSCSCLTYVQSALHSHYTFLEVTEANVAISQIL